MSQIPDNNAPQAFPEPSQETAGASDDSQPKTEEKLPETGITIVNKKPLTIGGKDKTSGRFVKGNKLGRGGDPYAVKKEQFRAAVYKCTTKEDMHAVWQKCLQQAKGNSFVDRKLVLEYLIGPPVKKAEIIVANLTSDQIQTTINGLFGVSDEDASL